VSEDAEALGQFVERVLADREAQGKGRKVTDPALRQRLAAILVAHLREQAQK
jgi:hypothetical protein